MTVSGVSAKVWRAGFTVAVAVAAMLAASPSPASADPRPTVEQARAKLNKLNDEVDRIVDRFNAADERWKNARKSYKRLSKDYEAQRRTVEGLRAELKAVAVSTYQGGWLGGPGVALRDDPAGYLGGIAAAGQLSAERGEKLRAFEKANSALAARYGKAKDALRSAKDARGALAEEKAKTDRLVAEQTKLLRRLGAFRQGNPNSRGQTYSGPASGNARSALVFAFAQIGKPYQYGAEGPNSFDCSGFSQAAWRSAGVTLPRTTYSQWAWGASRRVPLDLDHLQPGDLLFSKGLGHMGIYAGNGRMVHAPRTGDVVKVVALDDYWWGRLQGAVRP